MTATSDEISGTGFSGVSLPSFLQMLEQERKSCALTVTSGEKRGVFHFDNGELIDAVYGDLQGLEAAHVILLWENPSFTVMPQEDRMRRIHRPLAHILLDSAKRLDEKNGETALESGAADDTLFQDDAVRRDPFLRKLAETIGSIVGIKHYYFLDRQGKVIAQSSRKLKLGDFITYSIVSGIQMRKILNTRGPNRIHLNLDTGETLLIIPGAGMIIGLLLDELASVNEVADKLRPALTR